MNRRRVGILEILIGLFCVMLGFRIAHGASLPVPTPQPYYPQWWSTAVAGPLIQFQQDDTTAHQTILQLRKADGTIEVSFNIDGDGVIQGVLGLGNFTTVNLPTGKPVGSLAFDTTANAPKYLNNSSTWTAFPGAGTVTGTGTNNHLTKWSNGPSGVLADGQMTDDGTHVSLISALAGDATHSLFTVGGTIAAGNANGNYLGINSYVGFGGNFEEYEVNGSEKWFVDSTGKANSLFLTPNSFLMADAGHSIVSGTSTDLTASGTTLNLVTQGALAAGTYVNPSINVNSKGIITGIANGSSAGVTGAGTANTVAKFTGANAIGNSTITDTGTLTTIGTSSDDTAVASALALQTVTKTTTYTLAHETVCLADATGGAFAVNLPAASTQTGRLYTVKKKDATGNGAITITPNGADKIDGAATLVVTNQYDFATLISDGTNWYVVSKQVVPMTVAQGGTGQPSLTSHSVLLGAGTAAVNPLTVGATGKVLIGNTGADPSWGNVPSAAASPLQDVLTAGATSTVNTPMTLSTTTQAAFSATVADNHYAITGNGGASGDAIQGNVTGDKIVEDLERTYGGGTTTTPLLNIHDNSQTVSTADLIKAIGNNNTNYFELDASGNATFSALGNASGNYLSVNSSGKLIDNTGTPLTSNPTLQAVTTAGATTTNDITTHNIFAGANHTYDLGASGTTWSTVWTLALSALHNTGPGPSLNVGADGGHTGNIVSVSDTSAIIQSGADSAANLFSTKLHLGSATGVQVSTGSGSPNGAVTGSPGDLYLNTAGGAGTTLYVKESGSATNTGWVGK